MSFYESQDFEEQRLMMPFRIESQQAFNDRVRAAGIENVFEVEPGVPSLSDWSDESKEDIQYLWKGEIPSEFLFYPH